MKELRLEVFWIKTEDGSHSGDIHLGAEGARTKAFTNSQAKGQRQSIFV